MTFSVVNALKIPLELEWGYVAFFFFNTLNVYKHPNWLILTNIVLYFTDTNIFFVIYSI